MATKMIKKTVTYRKAQFHNVPHGLTLEQLLSTARLKVPTISSRREATDPAASEFRFISDWGAAANAGIHGRLSIIQKSKFPVALLDDPTKQTLPLKEFYPPAGHDYSPGVSHFVVVNNHVAMTQSTLLRSSALEAHLAWLLRDQTKQLHSEQGLSLSDEPQKATKDRIRRSHVKSVMLGRPIFEASDKGAGDGKRREIFQADTKGPIAQLLQRFIGVENFDKLGLKEGVFESNLEVWIEIRYPKHSRSQTPKSIKLLDELSLALRDVDEEEIKLTLSDGSIVTGKQLKISSQVDVATDKHGLHEDDLYQKMRTCLKDWIKNGIVSAN